MMRKEIIHKCIDNAHNMAYDISAVNMKGRYYMSQTNLTIRIDEGIKQEAETLFNKIGLNMSAAINVFFRQAIREQSIPFELKPYDDYFTDARMNRILRSINQAEKGEIVTKSFTELEIMAND